MIEPVEAERAAARAYDLVVIGTGFGSSFFLNKALRRRRGRRLRVLVLERGRYNSHAWQVENHRYSDVTETDVYTRSHDWKPWWFTIGLGGGMNCWGAYPPRFHPKDFRLHTHYGVGRDWPYAYDALEPYYSEAEALMDIAGDDDIAQIFPRSRRFTQRPHHLSTPDAVMKAAMPEFHFGAPSARMVRAKGVRNACCASSTCEICPVNSKFTLENGMADLYRDPRIDVVLEAHVHRLETEAGAISGVTFTKGGREYRARGDLYVLGANAVMSPFILMKSGLADQFTGRGLHEKLGFSAEVLLAGMDNFDGGARNVGANYALYDGPWRRTSGAALVNFQNFWLHGLRFERERWRQILPLAVSLEDLPNDDNRVTADGELPHVEFSSYSDYAHRGIDRVMAALPDLLTPLPVESIEFRALRVTHGHMQGTLRMGSGPENSTVDSNQIHHAHRNLVVVGSAVFPACAATNPSLTVAATSLRIAERIF